MLEQPLKFFVVFFVVVEPVSLIPLFSGLTAGATVAYKRRMALKAVSIAAAILLLFALGGAAFLALMGISIEAFRIFGDPAAVSARARDGVRARIGRTHLKRRGGGEPPARGHLGLSAGFSLHRRAGRTGDDPAVVFAVAISVLDGLRLAFGVS